MEWRCNRIYPIAFLVLFFGLNNVHGQDVLIRSGFFLDSIKIGDHTGFYLTAEYPSNQSILFPDSTYSFAPFEYEKKIYFPTKTTAGKSYDSVVYYLSTFEIDPVQSLALPVFQLNPMDCTTYLSPRDTILLTELVKNLPDSVTAQNLPLKVNTAYQNVSYLFNYPILIIVLATLLVLAVIGWVVYGKKIKKHFRQKRMKRAHQKFLESYNNHIENIKSAFSSINTENALSLWKKYMEQLEARPYTKMTTRETIQLDNNESLGRNLHTIDGAIYGHTVQVVESLEGLKAYADERFVQKLEELRHG
jgi:hypothetical protein